MIIKKVTHPDAYSISRAWKDEAAITGQPYVEHPFWYENKVSGQMYYGIFGCIGWPTEVTDKSEGMPGYAAIIGVVKQKVPGPINQAPFVVLTETESADVPTLLSNILEMRADYGFGLHPELLHSFLGDPERFTTLLAILNERLTKDNKDKESLLVSPPDDFYLPKAFDIYVRSFRSVLMPDKIRFYFGNNEILKNRLRGFKKNDPAIFAVGGLIHSLISQTMWMELNSENAFNVTDEGDE